MLRARHRWKWKDVRRRLTAPTGRWQPIAADGIELFNLETVPVTRYRYRGNTDPQPLAAARTTPDGRNRGEPGACESTHAGFGERPGETDREQSRHRAPGRLNSRNGARPSAAIAAMSFRHTWV